MSKLLRLIDAANHQNFLINNLKEPIKLTYARNQFDLKQPINQ